MKQRTSNIERRTSNVWAWILATLCGFFYAGALYADITATVYPGYQFSPLERPTTQSLNALGMPTIVISGTLGGTNVALGAGTVTGTMLSGTVVDGVTVDFNGSTPRAIEVMTEGIGTQQLARVDFAGPIAGGLDTQVHLLFDGVTLLTNGAGQLFVAFTNMGNTVFTNLPAATNSLIGAGPNGTNQNIGLGTNFSIVNGQLRLTRFISTNINLLAHNSFTIAVPHGLSNAPTVLRWVMVCTTAELGYSVGDEVDLSTVSDNGSGTGHWNVGANATNVFVVARNNNNIQLYNFTTQGTGTTITLGNWKLKCYAYP